MQNQFFYNQQLTEIVGIQNQRVIPSNTFQNGNQIEYFQQFQIQNQNSQQI